MVWLADAEQRQQRTIHSLLVAGIAGILLALWLLAASRLRWRTRLLAVASLAAVAAGLYLSLEVKGVTGDLVPILGWRWSSPSAVGPPLRTDSAPPVAARDYPQFRGPGRDGIVRDVALEPNWRAHPPREVWRRPVGAAWSSFAVSGRRAVTQEQHGAEERVVCYELHSGRELWRHADRARYSTVVGGAGPRATPAIADGRVYTMGATGLLDCLDLERGTLYWQRDVMRDNGATPNQWGVACSPLLWRELVIVSAGGTDGKSLVAYRTADGTPAWRAGSDPAGYSSPRLATLAGREQVLIFNSGNVAAHDPATGKILWQQRWAGGGECIAMPLPLPGDRLLVSNGYGVGARLFQLSPGPPPSTSLLWRNKKLQAKFTNLIHREGHVYALADGVLVCHELASGARLWRGKRYGHGQLLLAGDLLLVGAESGDLVLVRADPAGAEELGRIEALSSKTWNPPAFAVPYLLLRNDREAVCYRLALR